MGVTAAMACASLVAAPIVAQAQSKTQANQQKDVQVIAFQQTWNTIAKECTTLWSGRCGLCGGLASAGIHPRHAVVDQLPACELQARLQAGHGSRIQEHGSAVLRGRRGHHRRRGAQPDHRRRRGRRRPEGRGRQRIQRLHPAATRDSPPSSIRTASPQQTSTAATRTSPTTPIRRKFRNAA